MREILKGIVDIHVHGHPSVAIRYNTNVFIKEASEAGYKAFVLKDHFVATAGVSTLLNEVHKDKNVQVIGSIVLNDALGGFNLNALDVAVGMGARIVYMPTTSAENHLTNMGNHSWGGGITVPEKPLRVIDGKGELISEVIEVLGYISKCPQLVLATGHISAAEVDALLNKAHDMGIKKMCVNHPYFICNATYEQMANWVKLGAYMEMTAVVFEGLSKAAEVVPLVHYANMLEKLPLDYLIMSTDFGQQMNGSPVAGMLNYINIVMTEFGVTEEQINTMTKGNPSKLLEL